MSSTCPWEYEPSRPLGITQRAQKYDLQPNTNKSSTAAGGKIDRTKRVEKNEKVSNTSEDEDPNRARHNSDCADKGAALGLRKELGFDTKKNFIIMRKQKS